MTRHAPSLLRAAVLLGGAALLGGVPAAPATATPAADRAVARAVRAAVVASGLGPRVSVSVRNGRGTVVWAVRDRVPRVPASNQKLVTGLAALDVLGPDFRFETTAMGATPIRGSVLRGDLYLVGAGDPMLSTRSFARRTWAVPVATVDDLAGALWRSGLRRVDGRVVADASLFDRRRGVPTWKPGFLGNESAPLSALAIDRSAMPGTPELVAARALRRALVRRGIRVRGRVTLGRRPATARTLARVVSPRLRRILRLVGKDSDNFTAEMALKAVGAHGRPGRGSTAAGARAVREALARRGVLRRGVRIADGSGLSYANRTTTSVLTDLLVEAARDGRVNRAFRDTLAIAGVDGTLRDRMTTGPARRRVRAKTGTLDVASALSGYAGRYAFSVIVNAPSLDVARARALQDRVAQILARHGA